MSRICYRGVWAATALVLLLPVAAQGTSVYEDEADFLAAAPYVSMESFEELTPTNALVLEFVYVDDFVVSTSNGATLGVYNGPTGWGGHATDGEQFVCHQTAENGVTYFDLYAPVNAFGMYITDWGDWGTGSLYFSNDAGDYFTVKTTPQPDDGEFFFGVVNESASFTHVEFINTVPGEAYSFDQVYYGIPEPASLSLLALAGLVAFRRR